LPAGLKIGLATEDGSAGERGLVTDLIPAHAAKADAIFACGPVSMYKTLSWLAREMLPDKPVQVSVEARMGCGVGGCFSCAINTSAGVKLVCRDGPIFELRDVDWDWVTI
jgi:dihydroorotate dehydrogenase electron transfer subunit